MPLLNKNICQTTAPAPPLLFGLSVYWYLGYLSDAPTPLLLRPPYYFELENNSLWELHIINWRFKSRKSFSFIIWYKMLLPHHPIASFLTTVFWQVNWNWLKLNLMKLIFYDISSNFILNMWPVNFFDQSNDLPAPACLLVTVNDCCLLWNCRFIATLP